MGELHLVQGNDEVLVAQAVAELTHRLVGDGDRSLVLEDVGGDEADVRSIVAAAQTPPFLTDTRVVVGRGIEGVAADDVAPLAAYVAAPLDTTHLVLVALGKPPKKLLDALKSAGAEVHDTVVGSNRKDRAQWVADHVAASGLRLDAAAVAALSDRLGEDLGRLQSILETLEATFGPAARLGETEVRPFLGEAGAVPPWDLTDAIDAGDTDKALHLLARMMHAGERHPLQVMAILHGHYVRMLRLDGAGARSREAAAQVLGVKSPFQAGKALDQLQRLGAEQVHRAVQLLAQADLDLRGARDWPEELVMEVLVARLARLAPSRPARSRR